MPGNPALAVLGKAQSAESPQAVAALEVQYGVRTPAGLWGQYTQYWVHLLHGNLGISLNACANASPAESSSATPSRVARPFAVARCPACRSSVPVSDRHAPYFASLRWTMPS